MNGAFSVNGSLGKGARFLALAGLVAAAGCGGEDSAAEEAPKQVNVGTENVAVVMNDQIDVGPVISGSLKARSEAQVRAEIGGTVMQVFAERGQPVARARVALLPDLPLGAAGGAQQATPQQQQPQQTQQQAPQQQAAGGSFTAIPGVGGL